MTVTTAPTVKDKELDTFGLVESAGVNSISDFIPTQLNEIDKITEKEEGDFINLFICHLIFYAVFCVSIFLHILIDLGLGLFIQNKFVQLIELGKKTVSAKRPVFA